MLSGSKGQELGQDTVEMAYLLHDLWGLNW